MIIVLATVRVLPERMTEALALSHAHVARSRAEPGCLSHAVHLDPEHQDQLHFVEEWASEADLIRHIAESTSVAFVQALITMAVGRPRFRLFSAQEMPFPRTGPA